MNNGKLTAQIGLRAATVLVVSVIVGSGVFKKIAPMADTLGSPLLVLGCWLLAGLVSLAGALSNAEMAALYPQSGGEYVYYQSVYGRFFAFLYGWANFTILKTAAIAALAYVFAQSLNSLWPLPELGGSSSFWPQDTAVKGVASLLIMALSAVNYRGVRQAETLSTGLTYLTMIALAGLIITGFSSPVGSWYNLTEASHLPNHTPPTGAALIQGVFLACLSAFWGYEGWNHIGYLGEEVRQPQRTLPLALALGTGFVIVLYMLLNAMFLSVLPIDRFIQLAEEPGKIAAVEVARTLWGSGSSWLIALVILATTFTATNSSILMSARIYYAMARDGLFFRQVATVHSRFHTPGVAIVWQMVWSVVLVWSGSFDQLTDRLIFVSFIFYGATALGVILLRRREPLLHRPYRVVAYPWIPAFFVGFCAVLVLITLWSQTTDALIGLALVATGIPFYWYWKKRGGG